MPAHRKTINDLVGEGGVLRNTLHDRYAQFRAAGYSQYDSYCQARPEAKTSTRATVNAAAARVEARPEVRARITQLQQEQIRQSDALLSRRQLGEMIADEIRHMSMDVGGLTAAAGLIDKYCKMFGLYEPERHEVTTGAADKDSVNAKIAELLRKT